MVYIVFIIEITIMINLDNPQWEYVGQGSYGEVYRLAGTNLALKLMKAYTAHSPERYNFGSALGELMRGLGLNKSRHSPRFYGVLMTTFIGPDSNRRMYGPGILMEYVGDKIKGIRYSRFSAMFTKANKDFNKYGYEIYDPNHDNFRVIRNKNGSIKKFWYVDMGGVRRLSHERA